MGGWLSSQICESSGWVQRPLLPCPFSWVGDKGLGEPTTLGREDAWKRLAQGPLELG